MRYVIVGNGICGMEAALTLRERSEESQIILVSAEHDHLFSRPALMYLFSGQLRLQDAEPYDRRLYHRMRFERVRSRVEGLDHAGRTLRLEGGERLGYDKLLLAVGSQGRSAPWPGAEGEGIHRFVTLQDLEHLDKTARRGMRAAVIGGGLIGVEVAEILAHRGLKVTFFVRESWYFPVALNEPESRLVAEHLRGHGLDVRLGAGVDEILRSETGEVRGVRSGGGVVDVDLIVSAIGVVPNTGFLRESGLDLSRGGAIEVDESLRTNLPSVWAAGDCANVSWFDGSRRPEQLWYTARDQGRVAARSMLGDDARYRRGTWYNSAKFFDIEYTTAGWVPVSLNWDNTPAEPDPDVRTWFHRVPDRLESQRVVLRGDQVVGFNMLGSRWRHEPLIEWIEERRPLRWVLDHLSEAQFDEELSRRFVVHAGAAVP